jgi:hypothetical protein
LTTLLATAQSVVENYVGYPLELSTGIEYYDGEGNPDIVLRRPFVLQDGLSVVVDNQSGTQGGSYGQYGLSIMTGVLTTDSVNVTGLSSTSGLSVGQFVEDGNPPTGIAIALPCYIASIVSPTSITLTQPAKFTGSFPIIFSQAYGQSLALTNGTQYALRMKGQIGQHNRTGLLRCLWGPFGGWGSWGAFGGSSYAYGSQYSGTLTPQTNRNAGWPASAGGIQVAYKSGFIGQDSNVPNVPADICAAIVQVAQFMALNFPTGGITLTNESLSKYSYGAGSVNMATSALAANGELGVCREILSRYRNIAF